MLIQMVCRLVRWEEDQGRWLKNWGVLIYVTCGKWKENGVNVLTLRFELELVKGGLGNDQCFQWLATNNT